jgi:ABC-type glycerol-3-phosphate transport system permease component
MTMFRTRGDKILDAFIIIFLLVVSLIALYPIWFVLIASVSAPAEIGNGNVLLLPRGLNCQGYISVFQNKEIWTGYRNSLLYMAFGTSIDLAVTLSCGYALSRPGMPLRRVLSFVFIFTMYFSGGIIPMYLLLKDLHMLNTPFALIIPGSLSAYNLIIARSYFEHSLPEAIYESAVIDGSSKIRFYFQFALPLSSAMIAVLALFFALGHWNAYFGAMMYITSPKLQTLQVIIKNITSILTSELSDTIGVDELIANAQQKQLLKYSVVVVSAVPMLLLYPLVQKYFVKGIMIGAVKG